MLSLAIGYYFVISLVVFFGWFKIFLADATTPKTDVTSWVVLLLGTIFWPVVLPLSYAEIFEKVSQRGDMV